MTLDEARAKVGHAVVYTPFDGCPPNQLEEGVITSVGQSFVFVRYGRDYHPKATDPEDLALVAVGRATP